MNHVFINPARNAITGSFSSLIAYLYPYFWSLIPKAWKGLVLDPTKTVQPDYWSLKKRLIPIPWLGIPDPGTMIKYPTRSIPDPTLLIYDPTYLVTTCNNAITVLQQNTENKTTMGYQESNALPQSNVPQVQLVGFVLPGSILCFLTPQPAHSKIITAVFPTTKSVGGGES